MKVNIVIVIMIVTVLVSGCSYSGSSQTTQSSVTTQVFASQAELQTEPAGHQISRVELESYEDFSNMIAGQDVNFEGDESSLEFIRDSEIVKIGKFYKFNNENIVKRIAVYSDHVAVRHTNNSDELKDTNWRDKFTPDTYTLQWNYGDAIKILDEYIRNNDMTKVESENIYIVRYNYKCIDKNNQEIEVPFCSAAWIYDETFFYSAFPEKMGIDYIIELSKYIIIEKVNR